MGLRTWMLRTPDALVRRYCTQGPAIGNAALCGRQGNRIQPGYFFCQDFEQGESCRPVCDTKKWRVRQRQRRRLLPQRTRRSLWPQPNAGNGHGNDFATEITKNGAKNVTATTTTNGDGSGERQGHRDGKNQAYYRNYSYYPLLMPLPSSVFSPLAVGVTKFSPLPFFVISVAKIRCRCLLPLFYIAPAVRRPPHQSRHLTKPESSVILLLTCLGTVSGLQRTIETG